MLFRDAVALGLLSLVFGLFHHTVSGAARDASNGFGSGTACLRLLAISGLLGLSNASDKLDKAVSITFGRNGGDL
jgi:hypothetical protein